MSAHDQVHPRPHGNTRTYVMVAAILTVLTLVEFGIIYVESMRGALIPVLLVLSAIKFALVVMFFMHLKFDSKLLTLFFLCGLGIAGATILAVVGAMAYGRLF